MGVEIKGKAKALIVGTGFSGICAAIKLREIGIEDFLMIEKEDNMGGTWYVNRYPGAAVDVSSYLYCYSFEPYNWSRKYAMQDEIFAYTNHVIDKHKLREKTLLNTELVSAKYIEETGMWQATMKNGDVYEAKYVIGAQGILVEPSYPKIEGMDSFKGTQFHSARWNEDYDVTSKRVAVIGTAASAIQVIPAIVDKVKHLTVFQRTPHWVTPRLDREFYGYEKLLLKVPLFRWLYREYLYWVNESRMLGFAKYPHLMKYGEKFAINYMKRNIKDPEMRKKLTPNFGFGCKRVLISSEYYKSLVKPNVTLEADGIKAITEKGILLPNGKEIELDAIIYSTGYNVVNFIPFDLTGEDGADFRTVMERGLHAYMGSLVPKFPNLFITLGPNTGVGHTSALHLMESQVGMAMKIIQKTEKHNWKSASIKQEEETKFNDWVQEKLKGTIWVKGGCKSWYQDLDGKNRVIYPDYSFRFRKKALNPDFSKLKVNK